MNIEKLINWMFRPTLSAPRSTILILYFGTSPLPLPPAPPQIGIWAVLHEIRSDYAQILSALFLFVAGPGPWSLDALAARLRRRGNRR